MRFSSSYAFNQHSCDSSRSDITHSAHDIAGSRETRGRRRARESRRRDARVPVSRLAEPERARAPLDRGPAGPATSRRGARARTAPGAAKRRPLAAAALPAAAPCGRSSTQEDDSRPAEGQGARDPVSRDTQKARAARPRTSPSKDVGCCSCAQLAVPEQQRSCQHAPSTHSKKRSERQSVGRATRSTGE